MNRSYCWFCRWYEHESPGGKSSLRCLGPTALKKDSWLRPDAPVEGCRERNADNNCRDFERLTRYHMDQAEALARLDKDFPGSDEA